MTKTQLDLKQFIRDIPDFPKKGIIFKDITTLLNNPQALREAIDRLAEPFQDLNIDHVIGIESRGFIFGAVLADRLGAGFVPVRKKGKLPGPTKALTYDLEYGTDTVEIHRDAFAPNSRVIIVDDLLATGGTVRAVADLVRDFPAKILGLAFLVELTFLNGREKIKDFPVTAVIQY